MKGYANNKKTAPFDPMVPFFDGARGIHGLPPEIFDFAGKVT